MATSETEIGMPAYASYTITFIRQTTATVVEIAGHPRVGSAASAGGTIILGSVDVIDAANNGSFEDVSVQSGGLLGAVVGGAKGAAWGAAAGTAFFGPVGGFFGSVAGGVFGAIGGEMAVEKLVDGLFNMGGVTGDVPSSWRAGMVLQSQGIYADVEYPTGYLRSVGLSSDVAGAVGLNIVPVRDANGNVIGEKVVISPAPVIPEGGPGTFPTGNNSSSGSNSNNDDDDDRGSGSSSYPIGGPGTFPVGSNTNSGSSSGNSNSGGSSSYPIGGPGTFPVGSNTNSGSSSGNSNSGGSSSYPIGGPGTFPVGSNTKPGNSSGNSIPGGNEHDEGRRPIIMDLDGDGVEVSLPAFVQFDMDNDGFLESTYGWAGPDDGFLVIDLNADGSRGAGDGRIDQTKELVISEWGNEGDTDLQALDRAFDKNNDGVLDSEDAVWDELKIWRDLDQDGVSDAGEVKTLADWKIKSINLKYDNGSGYGKTSDDIDVGAAVLHGLASYTKTNGKTVNGGVGDMSLTYNALGWKKVTTSAGFDIIFEQGRHLRYFDVTGKSSADVNLDGQVLDGAQGDDRANSLIATGHSRNVQISGEGGNDTIRGSVADYV
jgi:hypothetical protein